MARTLLCVSELLVICLGLASGQSTTWRPATTANWNPYSSPATTWNPYSSAAPTWNPTYSTWAPGTTSAPAPSCPDPDPCNSRNCCQYFTPPSSSYGTTAGYGNSTGPAQYVCIMDGQLPPQYMDISTFPATRMNAESCYLDHCKECPLAALRCGCKRCSEFRDYPRSSWCNFEGFSSPYTI